VRNFRLNVLIRVILLCVTIFVLIYALQQDDWFMTTIFAGVGVLLVMAELIRYVEKANRDLHSFLLSVKYKDFTNTFTSSKRGKSFKELNEAFQLVTSEFQNLRAEKESQYRYLQNVIEHVRVALICFNPEGEILLLNRAAKQLLNKPYLNNIESLAKTHPKLLVVIRNLNNREQRLVKVLLQHELVQLAVQSTEFKLQDQEYKLVSLQNIRSELEAQEIETWQKLIRVLTHEIMNSVTPIISLTESIDDMLEEGSDEEGNLSELEEDDVDDIRDGIKTIMGRTRGMLHFVDAYRNLARIPKPNFQKLPLAALVHSAHRLLQPEMDKRNIHFEISIQEPSPEIQGDADLLSQVLINLLKNAMEALDGQPDPKIGLTVLQPDDSKAMIKVEDNGPGISDEFLQQIFIPFFTTKKRGSGIGLSLSRQIMRMHRGNISVKTREGRGTEFTLGF
jgi:nitrogen fixation/metabolism regulation signal transduction histidine kinase